MGNKTIVILRINPKNQETGKTLQELEKVKSAGFRDAKEEEIGFGIKVIKAAFLVKERDEQAIEKLLEEIDSLKSVENAEVVAMTLL